MRQAPKRFNSRKVPVQSLVLDVDWDNMEISDFLSLTGPDIPDALQGISIPKSLRFNTTPSEAKVERLDYAIKHIFVPPRLPNRADINPQLESALLGLISDCAASFKDRLELGSDAHAAWELICAMLTAFAKLHDGELTEDSVKTALSSMAPGGEMAMAGLFLHLLIFSCHRCTPDLHCGTECSHHPTTPHHRSRHLHAGVFRSLDTAQGRYAY